MNKCGTIFVRLVLMSFCFQPMHTYISHSLTLLRRQLSLICDACGITEENDFCYSCLPCQFWIHSSCAASPATIKLRFHQDDTLHLIYSVPHMYRSFTRHCQICKNEVLKDKWAYFCEDSGYFVHITCARTLLAYALYLLVSTNSINPKSVSHF